jgi:hypothetical protein
MRLLGLAIGLAAFSPICAVAQIAADRPSSQAPADADALSAPLFIDRGASMSAAPAIHTRGDQSPGGFGGAFATPGSFNSGLSGQMVVTGRVAAAGEGLLAWRGAEMSRAAGGGAVDSVRFSVAGISRTPVIGQGAVYDPTAVDVAFTRAWPSAMVVSAGAVGLSVSPHAGFGLDSYGGNRAEAGAMVRISSAKTALQDRLSAMGVKNGAAYGDQGRWYVFAAVRGQSVGLNMMSGSSGALRQAGWSTDASSALVGDGQVGVGWRQGGVEASVGYVHRGIKVRNAPYGASDSFSESLAAMSLTFHPSW